MILRFRDTDDVEHVVTAKYVELEDMVSGEIHNEKWIFKEGLCYSCKGMRICEDAKPDVQKCEYYEPRTNTYSTGHNEEK